MTQDRVQALAERDLAAALGIEVGEGEHPPAWDDLLGAVRRLRERATPKISGASAARAAAAAETIQGFLGRVEAALMAAGMEQPDEATVREVVSQVALLHAKGFTEAEAMAGLGLVHPTDEAPIVPAEPPRPAAPAPPRKVADLRSSIPGFVDRRPRR